MTEYDSCRYADDKVAYGKEWLKRHNNIDYETLNMDLFPERVISYKLDDLSSYKPFLSDKLNSKDFLVKAGIPEIHIPTVLSGRTKLSVKDLLGLPEGNYIIKCGHASGWNFYFSRNDKFETLSRIVDKVNEYMTLNYAYIAGYEWQYESITPGYIIQKVFDKNMIDYQFFYEDGNLISVDMQIKADRNHVLHIYYGSPDGNMIDHYIGSCPILKTLTKKDKNTIQEILPYAEILSKYDNKNIKFARIDFLYYDEKPYFCEYTFSPYAGNLTYTIL